MEYNTILQKVEDQKSERNIAGKMFRYSGLILAVDFFSQKLNSEQIMEAAFDFINELLTLDNSSIYSCQNGDFYLKRLKGKENNLKVIKSNTDLKSLAMLHGNLLIGTEVLSRYFNEDIIKSYKTSIAVPIIVDSSLEGFILIPEKENGKFDNDDYIICEVLMKLFNTAMENFNRYNKLQSINSNLDEKIFNLFAINQSSKALLSELDLGALYNLSIGVFSELTQSSITGFVLYDEASEQYTLKSYRFIYNQPKGLHIELVLKKNATVEANRIIIDLNNEDDRKYFQNLFENGIEELYELFPQYIVLLIKENTVLGFVTLSTSVNGATYNRSVFELIESLASSTYISISNAQLFKQVNEQKMIIQTKLERLISLNNLVKNINSSNNLETLIDITIRTLNISFGVEKCLVALFDEEAKNFSIESAFNAGLVKNRINPNRYWNKVLNGRTAFAFDKNELNKFFNKKILDSFGDISAALIIPIYLEKVDIELIGVLIVFKFISSMISDEENVLILENITNHIAPIINNLNIIEKQKKFMLPDYTMLFKNDLKNEINQAKEYSVDLCIIKIIDTNEFVFGGATISDKLKNHYQKIYPVTHNTVYLITNNSANIDNEIREIAGNRNLVIKKAVYKKDFNTYQQFLEL